MSRDTDAKPEESPEPVESGYPQSPVHYPGDYGGQPESDEALPELDAEDGPPPRRGGPTS